MNRIANPATILNGGSLSDAVDLLGYDAVAVEMPSGWTAASLTFSVSSDGLTFRDFISGSGAEITLTVDADECVQIPEEYIRSFPRFVKFRSGTSAAPVVQGATRTLNLLGNCP